MKFIYALIVALCLMPLCIFGQTGNSGCNTIVIDSLPHTCGTNTTQWNENGILFEMNGCITDYGPNHVLHGVLEIDLSSLTNISHVSIDLIANTPSEDYSLYIGSSSVNSTLFSSSIQTITLDNPQNLATENIYITGPQTRFVSINIEYNCQPTPNPKIQVESEQGDVYIDDPSYGAILTSPNGSCFRVKVTDSGALVTEAVTCP